LVQRITYDHIEPHFAMVTRKVVSRLAHAIQLHPKGPTPEGIDLGVLRGQIVGGIAGLYHSFLFFIFFHLSFGI
jgi:hypothetical protein